MSDKLMNSLIIIGIIDLIILGICLVGTIILTFGNNYDATDVNKDGQTNSLDLLIVQKKILEEHEERCD